MKLEKQVVSLEPAKQMKDLGFEQKGLFWWDREDGGVAFSVDKFEPQNDYMPHRHITAYTVAELGEMLPIKTISRRMADGKTWQAHARGVETIFYGETEADARAALLIYLAENKLIRPAHITKSKLSS